MFLIYICTVRFFAKMQIPKSADWILHHDNVISAGRQKMSEVDDGLFEFLGSKEIWEIY